MTDSIKDIRTAFVIKLQSRDLTETNTLEIVGASFCADAPAIFGTVSENYAQRELLWYKSRSLRVEDIPGITPKIWENISSTKGEINSNYGELVFGNYDQYNHVLQTLFDDKNSRRAVAIYTRPTMHTDFEKDGMQDFICTNAVHYEIRDNKLHVVVQMRSNDAVFGYKNDYIWQRYIQTQLLGELMPKYPLLEAGNIIWQVASLHIYERHFYLVDHFRNYGKISVAKENYKGQYSDG